MNFPRNCFDSNENIYYIDTRFFVVFTRFSIFPRQACKKTFVMRLNQLFLICLDVFFRIDRRKFQKFKKRFCKTFLCSWQWRKFRHWKVLSVNHWEKFAKTKRSELIYVKASCWNFIFLTGCFTKYQQKNKIDEHPQFDDNEQKEYEWKESSQQWW